MALRIGIDLGGTKIEGIALDGSREVSRLRVDTPRGDYDATLDAIAAVVSALEQPRRRHGPVSAIGIPGALDPGNRPGQERQLRLADRPSARRRSRTPARSPVRLANDANCFAISEAADGAAAGADVVFGVIVGTGTGAGIVVHGRAARPGPTPSRASGATIRSRGRRPTSSRARPATADRSGCIETFLSGPALTRGLRRSAAKVRYRQSHRGLGRRRRPRREAVAESLCRPHGARAGERDQRPRPGRHRARRRACRTSRRCTARGAAPMGHPCLRCDR